MSQNVVSSFVEHNLHKQENPIVPSLMLNSHWVAVSLYDCINDYLIVSKRIDLYDEEWVLKNLFSSTVSDVLLLCGVV